MENLQPRLTLPVHDDAAAGALLSPSTLQELEQDHLHVPEPRVEDHPEGHHDNDQQAGHAVD